MPIESAADRTVISRHKPGSIDPDLEARLLALTLPTGEMAKVYQACAKAQRNWKGVVFVAELDGQIVGWALRWQCIEGKSWTVFVFVDPNFRRHGIGTALADESWDRLSSNARMRGIAWDPISEAFYETLDDPGFFSHLKYVEVAAT